MARPTAARPRSRGTTTRPPRDTSVRRARSAAPKTDWLQSVPDVGAPPERRARSRRNRSIDDDTGTRERLLRAAAEVIQAGGWRSASVAAVAARAGVAAGTLYRHFPSKADMFVEVFRAVSLREVDAMRTAVIDKATFADRFGAVVTTYADRALRNRRLAWALVYEPVDPLVDAERLAYRREYREGMAALLREGVAAGAIPSQDTDLAAAAVVGVIAESLVGPLSPVAGEATDARAIVEAIVTFCRAVIGLPAARSRSG